MKIGLMGLGKLGLPVALAIESKGHEVVGYDINPDIEKYLEQRDIPYREVGAKELLQNTNIKVLSIEKMVQFSEIIFVPIQTPHNPHYEGITRLPVERVDFDYTFLKNGIKDLANEIEKQKKETVVIIISTVLPGTIRKEIKPLLNQYTKLCYNPFFIAMGTTIKNFNNPEFVLFGMDDEEAAKKAEEFYKTIHKAPFFKCTIEEAEMIKVSYNTYITSKIDIANTIMEACHKMENIDCDVVTKALSLATERLISPKYLSGGMGDAGGCHPRDNIALSWLARRLKLSYDWYENLMICREKQTEWLADLIIEQAKKNPDIPIWILGKSFKKETNLIVGSCSILLGNILKERGISFQMFDPHVDNEVPQFGRAIFFIGTNHDEFLSFNFPNGSVVIDPWRYIQVHSKEVTLISVGNSKHD